MRRQTGPVQQWIDSIPSPIKSSLSIKNEHPRELIEKPSVSSTPTEPKDIPYSIGTKQPIMTVSAPINVPNATAMHTTGLPSSLPHKLVRDPSLQSDSSHCSSVESLLELRRADPEAILLGLGFGGCSSSPQENGSFSRIPKRFLQPSKLKGIAINDFMKQQQETSESFDSVSLGYRGLTGSPYVAPSEIVQKIMQRLREHESHELDPYAMYNSFEQYSPIHCSGTLSVLSPDNRQFLERPRSKSPDMRNKRMIIGQKSFAFGHDGDLIEINPSDVKKSFEDNPNDDPNVVENSEVSNNTVDNHDKIFEHKYVKEVENVLPKQLSFDSSMEFTDPDVSLPLQISEENSGVQNEKLDKDISCKEDILSNATLQNVSDIRRASDGYCDTKLENMLSIVQERRHSDGFVQTTEYGNESILTRKRKTLKRQTRISDVDAINYCNLKTCTSDTVQCKELECNLDKNAHDACKHKCVHSVCTKAIRSVDDKLRNETKNDDVVQCSRTFHEETHKCMQSVDDSINKGERDNSECCVEKTQPVDTEERTTCCCHSGPKKYWKKMEKIIQENRNLENMVTKNRREMAEIREMLSNVLSVRLEPGF
ncbi:hypothetical protein WH47_12289 [Habropoda laboriosa]|uniref:ITPR-interacting domain-containing protein n=2 Tax=Habropoda laboriosa TaxID=597456 RepID=A0A0L7RAR7_9HYME|nr:hypothetical protein WH47_12289 [Habropoda laboriosa]